MRLRQIAPVALILGLSVAAFFVARILGDEGARDDSEHSADVAAAQVRGRVQHGVAVAESLSRFMVGSGGSGVTSQQFESNASRWLGPSGFPAAAWVEEVAPSRRAAFERRLGHPIVTRDRRGRIAPVGSRPSYVSAALVSGVPPMAVPGIDLRGEAGMAAALRRASAGPDARATPLATVRDGTRGLFLVRSAPRLVRGVVNPGFAVVFLSEQSLRAAATDTKALQVTSGGGTTGDHLGGATVRSSFTEAGQRFDVVVPKVGVEGAAVALPWIVLAAGLILAVLAGALGVNASRRAKAQQELNRIFTLSSDLITVADFDGRFTRVNPAAEQILGYTVEELMSRPYLDFVHPDDRESTAAEAAAIGKGQTTSRFENRFVRKDGSYKVLEWTATPVVEDRVMHGMARDVTERRRAEREVERLADEQAALRRVATLVAQDAPWTDLFAAVTREVGTLLGGDLSGMARIDEGTVVTVGAWAAAGDHPPVPDRWPKQAGDPATTVAETRRPARWDDWTGVPGPLAAFIRDEAGVRSTVGCPIVVEGRVWGALAVHSKKSTPLPPDTEARMSQFTDLVGTAIANAKARAEVARLAEEQAALRSVATLVAREAPQAEVSTAIVEGIGQLLGAEAIWMVRYEDDYAIVVASSGQTEDVFTVGSRLPLGGKDAASRVFQTERAARVDDYASSSGPIAEAWHSVGIRSVVGAPIVVAGRLWGAMVTGTTQDDPLPAETESRLGQFTELMATAIANTESHARADHLAEEQAALRRVATLVAEEASPAEVFSKVAEELANVLGDVDCSLFRDEGDGTATAVALWGDNVSARVPVGTRIRADGDGVIASALREGRTFRIGDYSSVAGTMAQNGREMGIRSAVGCPIVVRGRIWGAMGAARYEDEAFPPESETRIARFAELVATAIANAEARAEIERLAEEQAALRRVATLVAQGPSPTTVFDGVAAEMEGLLDADQVALSRYEPDDEVTVVANRGVGAGDLARPGMRFSHEGDSVTAIVRRTERPARMEYSKESQGLISEMVRTTDLRVAVGAPIVVDGRLWGVIQASWSRDESPPADTEERMARFAELLDTAIANADSRDQLTASRARLLTADDDARRRVVRDLHDGAQQRLVHTIVTLKLARREFAEVDGRAASLLGEALEQAEQGNAELRELAHGILPAVLTRGGLRAGVDAFVARLALPVRVDVSAERVPAEIEASAYFIVAEALTNVAKHSHAERVEVRASVEDERLLVEVRDDGIGGADPEGHGLVGMRDRVTARGGRLAIESPVGGGTLIGVTLPLV